MPDQFAHLHVHTEYSMLDGAAKLEPLFAEAVRLGQTAIAITDHGNVFGAHDFYKTGKKHGVKAIIGLEAYLTPKTPRAQRTKVKWGNGGEDDVSGAGAYTHMTMLAETTEGMHNLFRMASLASLEGFYSKPRIDRDLLQRYGKGIIATTGCPSGEIQTYLRMGKYDEARASAAEFRDLFGQDNFFVELMDHGIGIEQRAHEGLIRLSKDLGLPLVATNDLHYVHPTDAAMHDTMLCIQSGSTMDDPKRFKFDSDDFYLKPAAEMRHLWGQFPEACDNTLLIAERCNVTFNEGANLMPRFDVPDGESEDSWLIAEVQRGLNRRYPSGIPADRQTQADYEVGVILQMGFPGYFLVTADFIMWAKAQGIRVGPGRGSAAGSLVAYVLGITELDPIVHGLLFERFLNPERVSMPDIDVDFDDRRRGEVIAYVTQKYGADRVAQIVTFGKIKAKAAIRDSARVLGYPYVVGDKIIKTMPAAVMGKDIPLAGIFQPTHERYNEANDFRALYNSDPEVQRVVDTARSIEGLTRQWGVHAAGVIMSSEPLMDHIPIMKREADGAIITQFEQKSAEALGLLKMDFLGLRNLTVIDDALKNIEANRGITVDLDEISVTLDDPATYDLVARGDTLGVFQLDGGPMRSLLRAMKPEKFEHISAVLALYRPGPMGVNAHIDYAERKNGRQKIVPIHPELAVPLADVLGDTYGLIVYQEQVMAIAQKLAGYSLGGADLLRRAMGKKDKKILDAEYIPFHDGMTKNGYSEASISTLWEVLVPFSDYAFNRAHTAGYGLVSYWTAYLKANFPAEYMAALLTSVADDKPKSAIYLAECRRMGLTLLSPDVNASIAHYGAVGTDIRVGLGAIRNVGDNVIAALIRSRTKKGPFTDFTDFLDKIEAPVCNKKVVDSLIKSGAFDSMNLRRSALNVIAADACEQYVDTKKAEANGQDDLFGAYEGTEDLMGGIAIRVPDVAEWDKSTLLAFERDMLGLYVSDHPLSEVADMLRRNVDIGIGELLESGRSGQETTIGGLISSVAIKVTKKGDTMAVLQLEDLEAAIEVVIFPNTYANVAHLLVRDTVLLIQGKVERRDDQATLQANTVTTPDLTMKPSERPVSLNMHSSQVTVERLAALKSALQNHPGEAPIHLHVVGTSGVTTVVALSDDLKITPNNNLTSELKSILGADCLGVPDGQAPPASPTPPSSDTSPASDGPETKEREAEEPTDPARPTNTTVKPDAATADVYVDVDGGW